MSLVATQQAKSGAVVRRVAAAALAGGLSGFVVGGIGSRLAMRASAIIDPSATGLRTEAGETIGEITLEGSLSLMVFVGIGTALMVGIFWTLASVYLPETRWKRRAAGFVVAAALGSRLAIDGANIDFFILDPPLAQAAIYIVLAGLTGLVAPMIEERLVRSLPAPGPGMSVGYWATIPIGALLLIPMAGLFFSEEACGCSEPPWIVGLGVTALALMWLGRFVLLVRGRSVPMQFQATGVIVLSVIVVSGFAHLAGEIARFT